MSTELKRRTHSYILSPGSFGISGCTCGNGETQWSEFEQHLWCDKCEKDFIPEQGGVFDGPISVDVCACLGIVFDRISLETGEIEIFDPKVEGNKCYRPAETLDEQLRWVGR